jgi:membrane-bound metal-dependent hydrolase YbcI (DUF457 family)
MTSDEQPPEKTGARLVRALTGAKARILASAGVGLLVWADVISAKVPFYFLDKAALVAREAASLVASEAAHVIPDTLDQFEKNKFSVPDAAHAAIAVAVIYLGYRLFRRIWQALKQINPIHWGFWPRLGFRRKLLLACLLMAGAAAAWQLGAFPWIGAQFLELGRRTFDQLSWQSFSDFSRRLWDGFTAVYESKGTVLPAVKGLLAALATYATLEAARVMAELVSPAVRLGHAAYRRASPWVPDVRLSQRQKDWLHGAASVTGGCVLGFSDLSFPSVPLWTWAVLAPGLSLFAKERPGLVSEISKLCLKLARYFRRAAEFTLAQPKWAGGIIAGFMIGLAGAGAFLFSHPLLGFAIIWGVMKAAYAGTMIAVLIAAGRGSTALVAYARQIIGQLTMTWRKRTSAAP